MRLMCFNVSDMMFLVSFDVFDEFWCAWYVGCV